MNRCFLKITSILIFLSVIFISGCRKNRPPHTPYTPAGPSVGSINKNYNFSSLAIDPDDDSITIRFDWGNGDTTPWTSDWDLWFASEEAVTMSHSWSTYDTYYVRAQAMDKLGAISNWSLPFSIVVRKLSGIVWICATPYAFWSPRESHASVVFDNKMWIIGGAQRLPGRIECNDIWNSTDGINWTCVTDSAVFNAGDDTRAVVFDDKIWIIGGTEQWHARNDVWCSSDGVNWTCVTNHAQWSPRWEHRVVVYDNKIWVLGGMDSPEHVLNDVWYSSDGINWTCATESAECLGEKGGYFSTGVFNNKLWVTGGNDRINVWKPSFNDVWYSNNGRDWIQVTPHAPWRERMEHEMLAFDNKMWILGGEGWEGKGHPVILDDVWFSTDGTFWACETSSTKFTKRFDFTSVVYDNKIWVMGGMDISGGNVILLNDVWYRDIMYKK